MSLLLAGCTGGDEPAPSATASPQSPSSAPTSSASPSPVETVALPVMPEEAMVESDAGASAFVRHWFALVNYGYRTGDTEPLEVLSAEGCSACFDYVNLIDQVTGNGSRALADPLLIETVNSPPPEDGGVVTAVTYREQSVLLQIGEAKTTRGSDGEATRLEAGLGWEEGWTMLELGR